MKIWKVEVKAMPNMFVDRKKYYDYTGTAATAEIAVRQTKRVAKKDGLTQLEIENVSLVGVKQFGN